ncbi:MAG TPA: radical SAM protein [Terriglobia bacterium]|nr:radical SAM protein [Terriglobia bacterium]
MVGIMPSLDLLQIDLTEECPLFCGHCSNSSGPSNTTRFPLQKLIEIIDQAGKMDVKALVLSGGEPLCYPGLRAALKRAQTLKLPVTICTTGIRDKKTRSPIESSEWKNLKQDGLVTAAFSIYAAPEQREFHNQIVMLKPLSGDAFGANETAMRRARAAGMDVQAHLIPSDSSIADLQDIYDWAVSLECSVLHLQIPTQQGRNATSPRLAMNQCQEEALQRLASSLLTVSGTTFHVSRLWYQRWSGANFNCGANERQLIIRADGTISPCNACKYSTARDQQGNILNPTGNLKAVWESSPTLQAYRSAKARNSVCKRCQGIFAEYKQEENLSQRSTLLPEVRADGMFS